MSLTWQRRPSDAVPEMVDAYRNALHAALLALAQSYAPEIEAWMKENARWTDRTGNARQTLWAEAFDLVQVIVLAFGHGVDYGRFLEWAHAGRYAIVTPALDEFGPRIWADAVALVS